MESKVQRATNQWVMAVLITILTMGLMVAFSSTAVFADDACDADDRHCVDVDHDGYRAGHGVDVDCDDADETVFPGAREVYDGKDNDCDGYISKSEQLFMATGGRVNKAQSHPGLSSLCALPHWGATYSVDKRTSKC